MAALGISSFLLLAASAVAVPIRLVTTGIVYNPGCGYQKNQAVTFSFNLNEAPGLGEELTSTPASLRWPATTEKVPLLSAVTGTGLRGDWNTSALALIVSERHGTNMTATLTWGAIPIQFEDGSKYNTTNLIANGKWPVGIAFAGLPFPWTTPPSTWNNYFGKYDGYPFQMSGTSDGSRIRCPNEMTTTILTDYVDAFVNISNLVITTFTDCELLYSYFTPGSMDQVLKLSDLGRTGLVSTIQDTFYCPFLQSAYTYFLYTSQYSSSSAPWTNTDFDNSITIVDWGGAYAAVVSVLPPNGHSIHILGVAPVVGPTRRILFILLVTRLQMSGGVADELPFEFLVTVQEALDLVLFFRGENVKGVPLQSLNTVTKVTRRTTTVLDNGVEKVAGNEFRVFSTITGLFIGYGEEDSDSSNDGLLGLIALIILPIACCACLVAYFVYQGKQKPVRMDPPKDMLMPAMADPFWPGPEVHAFPAPYPSVASVPLGATPFGMPPPPPLPADLMGPFGGLPSTPMPYPMMP